MDVICEGTLPVSSSTERESSHSPLGELNGAMATPRTLLALVICGHIAGAFGAMYDAYTIESAGFVVNSTQGQMNHFMCSAKAGKSGHSAFRVRDDTGMCELGNITANAKKDPNGMKIYVESGITISDCVISPTINAQTWHSSRYATIWKKVSFITIKSLL